MIRNNFEPASAWHISYVTFNDWYESDSSVQYTKISYTDINWTFCVVGRDLRYEIIYVSRSERNTWPAFRMVCVSRILFLKQPLKLISLREGNDWNSKSRFSRSHTWKCEPPCSMLITVVDFGLYFVKQI